MWERLKSVVYKNVEVQYFLRMVLIILVPILTLFLLITRDIVNSYEKDTINNIFAALDTTIGELEN